MLLLRWHLLLTFRHRAGVRPYTSSFNFAKPCVFVKQSPGPFLCDHHCWWLPLSLSYGVILPSSLATTHSSALVFSTQLPVSVYGTGSDNLKLSRFSRWLLRSYVITSYSIHYTKLYEITESKSSGPRMNRSIPNLVTPYLSYNFV